MLSLTLQINRSLPYIGKVRFGGGYISCLYRFHLNDNPGHETMDAWCSGNLAGPDDKKPSDPRRPRVRSRKNHKVFIATCRGQIWHVLGV